MSATKIWNNKIAHNYLSISNIAGCEQHFFVSSLTPLSSNFALQRWKLYLRLLRAPWYIARIFTKCTWNQTTALTIRYFKTIAHDNLNLHIRDPTYRILIATARTRLPYKQQISNQSRLKHHNEKLSTGPQPPLRNSTIVGQGQHKRHTRLPSTNIHKSDALHIQRHW